MSPYERIALWIVAVLALGLGIYDFYAGNRLTGWAKDADLAWKKSVYQHGHGAGDHIPPPPPPPEW